MTPDVEYTRICIAIKLDHYRGNVMTEIERTVEAANLIFVVQHEASGKRFSFWYGIGAPNAPVTLAQFIDGYPEITEDMRLHSVKAAHEMLKGDLIVADHDRQGRRTHQSDCRRGAAGARARRARLCFLGVGT
jgi:hypothetical protein